MKAEELMDGDWVIFEHEVPGEPFLIPKKRRATAFDIYRNSEHLLPIPLTADILNQVGFKIDRDSAITTHLSFEEEEGGLIVFENPKGEFFLYTEYYDEEFSEYWTVEATKIVLRYVHELQHVLRIWGIEKKIVL